MQIIQKNLKVISLSDIHFGHEDQKALKLVKEFIKEERPDVIILNGDILDAYDASSFLQDPNKNGGMREEIGHAKEFLKWLRLGNPLAYIGFLEGNHEDRLRKVVWQSPMIAKLFPNLNLKSLLGLDELKIEHRLYGDSIIINNTVFTHGHKTSAKAPYDYMASYALSGTSGHTHNLGMSCKNVGQKTLYWVESGCLCMTNPEYVKGIANWHQGFAFGTSLGSNIYLKPMSIIGGNIV